MKEREEFNFEEFKKQAIAGMYAGKPFNGEQGILPTYEAFFEKCFIWIT